MALSTTQKVSIGFLVVFLILAFVAEIAEARRGGGGSRGSSRGSSRGKSSNKGRGSSSGSKSKSYKNVKLSGRISKGSSKWTSSNWKSAAAGGLIGGGAVYLATRGGLHSHRYVKMPIICTNTHSQFYEDGKYYKNFICPYNNDSANKSYCCGPERREYCCTKEEAQKYYAEHHHKGGPSIVGIIIGIIIIAAIVGGVCFCCKRKKHIARMFSTAKQDSDSSKSYSMTKTSHVPPYDPQAEPLNQSPQHYDPNTKGYQPPPPAFGTVPGPMPSAAFDGAGSSGVPYAPPPPGPIGFEGGAPYPPPSAVPPYPAPYPPPVAGGDMAYPPGNMAAPASYPTEAPPAYPGGEAPYPMSGYPPPPPGGAPGYPPYPPGNHTQA